MLKSSTVIGAGIFLIATGHAMAQLSSADRTFASKAAVGGQAEVALGRLAAEKRDRNRGTRWASTWWQTTRRPARSCRRSQISRT